MCRTSVVTCFILCCSCVFSPFLVSNLRTLRTFRRASSAFNNALSTLTLTSIWRSTLRFVLAPLLFMSVRMCCGVYAVVYDCVVCVVCCVRVCECV